MVIQLDMQIFTLWTTNADARSVYGS